MKETIGKRVTVTRGHNEIKIVVTGDKDKLPVLPLFLIGTMAGGFF